MPEVARREAKSIALLSSMAPRAILSAAAEEYWLIYGVRIEADAAGGVDVVRRIEAGETVDIVVLSSDAIDKLIASGQLARNGRHDLMTSGIAVAVKSGAEAPDLSDEDATRRTILAAPSISYSTGPSGRYLGSLFERWGILEDLRPRIVVPSPGIAVASLVSSGSVALGFQQLSEMLGVPGIRVVGSLPRAIQHWTTFTGATSSSALEDTAAEKFLLYLASPQRQALKQRFGMAGL